MAKTIDVDSVPQPPSYTLPEIAAGKHHEGIVTGDNPNDLLNMERVELDAFMEEKVMIEMAEFREDSGIIGVPLTVNEKTQWVVGGQRQTIKRKFVEALVHARSENFKQEHNQMDPTKSMPRGRTVPSYPFTVIDDSQKGRAWLNTLASNAG